MAKQKKQPEKSQKSLYLPNSLWQRIEQKAKEEKRSINNITEIALEKEFSCV